MLKNKYFLCKRTGVFVDVCIYRLRHKQDVTQGQFLSEVIDGWNSVFFFPVWLSYWG